MGCRNSKVAAENEKAAPLLKPWKERKCRDVLWLLIFIAFWVGNAGILYMTSKTGDTARLMYGVDAFGNQCGGKGSVCAGGKECGKFITYPRVDRDFLQAAASGKFNLADPTSVLNIPFFGLCVDTCPEGGNDGDGDGFVFDVLCEYNTTDMLNEKFPSEELSTNSMQLTPGALEAFKFCEREKQKKEGTVSIEALWATITSNMPTYEKNGQQVDCGKVMDKCYRSYVPERSLFFRCVPETAVTSVCRYSPYITDVLKKNPADYSGDHKHCGVCLDPEYTMVNGVQVPMDPSSDSCKAKRVESISNMTQATPNPVFEQINSWTAFLVRAMGDVQQTHLWVLLSGVGGAVVVSIVWLVLLRYFAGIFVWTVIWSLLLCLAFLTIQFLMQGGVITADALNSLLDDLGINSTSIESQDTNITTVFESSSIFSEKAAESEKNYRILGYVMLGLTGVYLVLVLSLSRKIRLAVQILKEATTVIASMPSIMLFPLLTTAASVGISVYWVFVSMLISSSGEITQVQLGELTSDLTNLVNDTIPGRRLAGENALNSVGDTVINEFKSSSLNTWFWVYNFFAYLWTNQIIQAVSACTIAGAVCDYYWASEFEEKKAKQMSKFPVLKAFQRTLRFHLGSLIFGSFVIAFVQLLRSGLAYLDKQTKTLQKKNRLVRILMKVVQCCMWCFEKILKFITKHAYIQIALKGSSFCTATKDGFILLISNLAKVGVLTAINNLIMMFAMLVISGGSGAICYLSVSAFYLNEEAPSSIVAPVLVAVLLAWFIGSLFMSVYMLTVDTILVCFCEDESHNDGTANRPYYMSKALRRIAKKSNKVFKSQQSEKKAASDEDDEDQAVAGAAKPDATPSQKQLL